jgi:hypothetical protein
MLTVKVKVPDLEPTILFGVLVLRVKIKIANSLFLPTWQLHTD